MATQLRSSLVLAIAATFVLASAAWAAPSDPPAGKKAAQAAGHGSQAAPVPAKKVEPAAEHGTAAVAAAKEPAAAAKAPAESKAAGGHGGTAEPAPAASHGEAVVPAKKTAKVDRKAIEADVRQVVTRINAAMKEESAKPQPKSAAKAESGGHGEPGPAGPAATARPARAAAKPRPTPLLVWDDTLKGTNVTLVWGPELAPAASRDGARLVWGEEKK